MIKGLVSCIIPTYKRCDSLIRAIDSVLKQTYKDIEVLIVDDNEPNDQYSLMVQEKLSNIKDNRVHYIQQEKHINGAVARNIGIKSAKGEFIAFLDDDDFWVPLKLEKQVTYLDDHLNIGGVSCLYKYYYNGKFVSRCLPYNCENLHEKVISRKVEISTSTALFRKKNIDVSGYFDEALKRHQDLQLFLDFLYEDKIALIQEYLVIKTTELLENRATANTIVEIKEAFFKQTKRHFELYDRRKRRGIYAAHYFDVVFIALKNRNIWLAIKFIMKIGINFKAYSELFDRGKARKSSKIDKDDNGK